MTETQSLNSVEVAEITCQFAGRCSGCEWIGTPYSQQLTRKQDSLSQGWETAGLGKLPPMAVHSTQAFGVRDRVDLVLKGGLFGLYDLERSALVDITSCPQLSPALESWMKDFRTDLPRVERGSIRLRVSPSGQRGVWLDFANLDVKRLLDEKDWLTRLNQKAFVEIGQKRKRLVVEPERLRLGEPVLENWMETFVEGRALPLYTSIGSFTQAGNGVNRTLVEKLNQHVENTSAKNWVELGAGAGNFTLPLLQKGFQVIAVENDPSAISGLERSVCEIGKIENLVLKQTSYEGFSDLPGSYSLLVDPPRSGLGKFLEILERPGALLPQELIYVSCWQESLFKDCERLLRLGFRPTRIDGVDLFPQTRHMEWILTFKK